MAFQSLAPSVPSVRSPFKRPKIQKLYRRQKRSSLPSPPLEAEGQGEEGSPAVHTLNSNDSQLPATATTWRSLDDHQPSAKYNQRVSLNPFPPRAPVQVASVLASLRLGVEILVQKRCNFAQQVRASRPSAAGAGRVNQPSTINLSPSRPSPATKDFGCWLGATREHPLSGL